MEDRISELTQKAVFDFLDELHKTHSLSYIDKNTDELSSAFRAGVLAGMKIAIEETS